MFRIDGVHVRPPLDDHVHLYTPRAVIASARHHQEPLDRGAQLMNDLELRPLQRQLLLGRG